MFLIVTADYRLLAGQSKFFIYNYNITPLQFYNFQTVQVTPPHR